MAFASSEYKYGFVSDVEMETFPKGISEEVIYAISAKKNEPDWLLEFRLKAFRKWQEMKEPNWANVTHPAIDYQNICYFSQPKNLPKVNNLSEVDPEILKTFERLGIPLEEQMRLTNVAVDLVFDSVSIGTTFQEEAARCRRCPLLYYRSRSQIPRSCKKISRLCCANPRQLLCRLNSAVFSDGSFVYIPKGVKCPMELSTYFRINDRNSGQFERTLIIAEERSQVSYLEGCTAPAFDTNQLHAAVVELIAMDDAEIKYSTIQNWYAGDPKTGVGGIYNFVTKRGLCLGRNSKISWTQVEAGAAITWKYPSCILRGDNSVGEFYSVALTNGYMQADTGTKMIHIGKNTSSTIVSKGISAEHSHNTYRGLVKIFPKADGARNYTQCDSMLVGDQCSANTFPYVEVGNATSSLEHEASTSKINEEQLFYFRSRGISFEDAVNMIVNGFCKKVLDELPFEFAQEAKNLLSMKLEHSVG